MVAGAEPLATFRRRPLPWAMMPVQSGNYRQSGWRFPAMVRPAARCACILEQTFPNSGRCGHHFGRRAVDVLRSMPSGLRVEQAAAMAPVT